MDMFDRLLEIVNGYHGKDYYVFGEIPQKKLQASTRFHGVDPGDKVLALLDSTIMGSAENGMSITLRGLYWKNMWATKTRKNNYTWKELQHLYENMELVRGNIIFEPGVEFYVPANYPGESLLNLLRTLSKEFVELSDHLSSRDLPADNTHDQSDDIFKQTVPVPMSLQGPEKASGYELALLNSLAVCVCSSGKADDRCVEIAIDFISSDEKILAQSFALERFSNTLLALEEEAKRSKAFFKLKQSKLIAEISALSAAEAEQIIIMLEAINEISPEDSSNQILAINKRIGVNP